MFTNYKGGGESNFIVEKSSRQQHVNQVIKVNFSRNGTNRRPALSGRIQSEAYSIPESNCNETADKVVHPVGEGNGGTRWQDNVINILWLVGTSLFHGDNF